MPLRRGEPGEAPLSCSLSAAPVRRGICAALPSGILVDLAVLRPDGRAALRGQAYLAVRGWLASRPRPHADGVLVHRCCRPARGASAAAALSQLRCPRLPEAGPCGLPSSSTRACIPTRKPARRSHRAPLESGYEPPTPGSGGHGRPDLSGEGRTFSSARGRLHEGSFVVDGPADGRWSASRRRDGIEDAPRELEVGDDGAEHSMGVTIRQRDMRREDFFTR